MKTARQKQKQKQKETFPSASASASVERFSLVLLLLPSLVKTSLKNPVTAIMGGNPSGFVALRRLLYWL